MGDEFHCHRFPVWRLVGHNGRGCLFVFAKFKLRAGFKSEVILPEAEFLSSTDSALSGFHQAKRDPPVGALISPTGRTAAMT